MTPLLQIVIVEEVVSWCPTDENLPGLSLSELNSFLVEGVKKFSIDDETTFCERETLLQVLQCKVIIAIPF